MINQSFDPDSDGFLHLKPNEKCEVISSKLKDTYHYWHIRKIIKDEIVKPRHRNMELNELIPRLLKELNLENPIKNEVFNICRKINFFEQPQVSINSKFQDCTNLEILPAYFREKHVQPLDILAKNHQNWSEHLKNRFNYVISNSTKRIFVKQRREINEKKKRKESDGQGSGGDQTVTASSLNIDGIPGGGEYSSAPVRAFKVSEDPTAYLYDPDTFLDWILKIENGNFAGNMMLAWGTIPLQIQTKSIEQLRSSFAELHITLRQIGVDQQKSFVDQRILIGERVLSKDYSPFIVQYAKRGVPPTLRNRIYKAILGIEMTPKDNEYFEMLTQNWTKWEIGLDQILRNDIKDMCNDDKYFIFQEILVQALFCFFRDPTIPDLLKALPNEPIAAVAGTDRQIGLVPPCGVLPCLYFSRLAAPLGYISQKPQEVFYIFKQLYCRYFCYLHTLSSHQQSIISLSKLFEDLLQAYEPEAWYHMQQMGISPLKVAFPWIFYAFSGFLEVDQVYLLWDRILGYNSLEVLSVLAAAIFMYRTNLIVNCTSQEEFDELFYDLSQLKIIPLMQHFLFAAGFN